MRLSFFIGSLGCSVNHFWGTHGHRRFVTKAGQAFREAFAGHLRKACAPGPIPRFEGRVRVIVALRAGNRRKYDIDNRVKPLLDCLQECGVIADDEQVDELRVYREPVDDTPRTSITVEALEAPQGEPRAAA